MESFCNLDLKIGCTSFFQANLKEAEHAVYYIINYLKQYNNKRRIIDAYSGIGTFSIPLSSFGDTVVFKNKWYGKSTTFTNKQEDLNYKPKPGQNDRSNKHLGKEDFDKKIHSQYLTHIDINNLKGLKIETVYNWKVGETMIMDRSHIHCASSRIDEKKLGLTTFTKK